VSKSFNVADLSPFFGLEESRTTPFRGQLPRLVWISSGCGSAVVWRSSRSPRGFGVSLPIVWVASNLG
jgi:hypothetical protein